MKNKAFFGIESSILFILLGVYLVTKIAPSSHDYKTLISILGYGTILFFGVLLFLGLRKTFKNKNCFYHPERTCLPIGRVER
jgi:membrane protein DedA with SNARE-associated domain